MNQQPGRSRRRRRRIVWWKRSIGGMPVWLSLSIVSVAVLGLGAVLVFRPATVGNPPTTIAAIETDAPVEAPTPTPLQRADLAAVQAMIAGEARLVLSVLGDSTGNDGDEWVTGWAHHLADQDATVTMHRWDQATSTYGEVVVYGNGSREIVIWNGSMPGRAADFAIPLIDVLQPEAPTVMLINFGHNAGKLSTGTAAEKLTTASDKRWGVTVPAVAMLQNPGLDKQSPISDRGRLSITEWADTHGVPTVDVFGAFSASPSWSTDYMRDAVHPNPAGSQIWVDTVIGTLG